MGLDDTLPLDYYRILQVDPSAEPEVVQAAYRRLAAKYHPDVAQIPVDQAVRRMTELNAAYAVLGNAEARQEYDHERPLTSGATSRPGGVRPRFRMEPAEIHIRNLDSAQRFATVEVDLFQIGGDPAEWDFDVTDFVLKGSFLRAFVESVETISHGHPARVRIILDLGYLGRGRGQSYFGSVNVRGDPDARVLLTIEFAWRRGNAGGTTTPNGPPAAPHATSTSSDPISSLFNWTVAPFRAQDTHARWLGISGRVAIAAVTGLILWFITVNIATILFAIVALLFLTFILLSLSAPTSRRKGRKRRKKR